jgi:hypothetical protein
VGPKLPEKEIIELRKADVLIGEFKDFEIGKLASMVLERLNDSIKKYGKEKDASRDSEDFGSFGDVEDDSYNEFSEDYGCLDSFMFALNLFDVGKISEANEIVHLLFEANGKPQDILNFVISQIADRQYKETSDKFFKDYDWQGYEDSVGKLLKKFPVGWASKSGVELLLEKLKKHKPQKNAEIESVEGLSKEDNALARELLSSFLPENKEADEYRYSEGSGYWYLKSAPQSSISTFVIDKIKERKLKSFPMLFALAADEQFTHFPRSFIGNQRFSSTGTKKERDAQDQYVGLNRPVSRGEVCLYLIYGLVNRESLRTNTVESVLDAAKKEYAILADKTEDEVILSFLKSADFMRSGAAFSVIMSLKDDSTFAMLEKFFLEGENPIARVQFVAQYVSSRGASAKPFVEKFCVLLSNSQPGPPFDSLGKTAFKAVVDKIVAALNDAISERSFQFIIEDFLADKIKADVLIASLANAVRKNTSSEVITMILDGAIKATDYEKRSQLMGLTTLVKAIKSSLSQEGHIPGMRRAQLPEKEEEKLDPLVHRKQWEVLLNDQRKEEDNKDEKDKKDQMFFGRFVRPNLRTISEDAAGIINALYITEDEETERIYGYSEDPRIKEIFLKIARYRLQGKRPDEFPRYPSSKNVTENRMDEIANLLLTTETKNLDKVIGNLTFDEEVSLQDIGQNRKDISENVRSYANRIISVEVTAPTTIIRNSIENSLSSQRGCSLSTAVVMPIFDAVKKMTEDGLRTFCSINRATNLRGIIVTFVCMNPPSGPSVEVLFGGRRQQNASLRGNHSLGDVDCYATWPVEYTLSQSDGDDTLVEDAGKSTNDPKAQEKFWREFGKNLLTESNVFSSTEMSFTGTPFVKTEKDNLSKKEKDKLKEKMLLESMESGYNRLLRNRSYPGDNFDGFHSF